MPKNIDEQVDKLEAAVDPNTVISVGGINFTPLTFKLLKSYYSWQQVNIHEIRSSEGTKKELIRSTVL